MDKVQQDLIASYLAKARAKLRVARELGNEEERAGSGKGSWLEQLKQSDDQAHRSNVDANDPLNELDLRGFDVGLGLLA